MKKLYEKPISKVTEVVPENEVLGIGTDSGQSGDEALAPTRSGFDTEGTQVISGAYSVDAGAATAQEADSWE